jgi:hypothetical protein
MPSPFYPLNYYLQRPYARAALRQIKSLGSGVTSKASETIALEALLPALKTLGWHYGMPESTMIASEEMQGILALTQWALNGKTLYSISEELVHAFSLSDCGQMSVEDVIDEPYNFYMHFEKHSAHYITLPGGALLEGAYVFHVPRISTRIVLCGRDPAAKPLERWQERYNLRLPSHYLQMPVSEAIDLALEEDLRDIRAGAEQFKNDDKKTYNADLLIARMIEGRGSYAQALQLVLNALAYKTGYSDDQKVDWPPEAPPKLVRQVSSESSRERARGESKLLELGFIPVTYVGKLFANTVVRNDGQQHKKAHWRRGHWRNQFYGEARALRKLIWLRPTLVGQTQLTEEVPISSTGK